MTTISAPMEKLNPNMEKQRYKVAILAAGEGKRLGERTADVSKALLPIAFKPVLSHVIEKFSRDTEIVVALGYKKEDLRDYIQVAHADRPITFVDVDNYNGPGSGPAYSLKCCKAALAGLPFIITTVDTLVAEEIPPPDEDWLGLSKVDSTERFNSVLFDGRLVSNMQDKKKCNNTHAFIGIAGIHNTELFWKNLEENQSLVANELQLSNGLIPLVNRGMKGVVFTWYDTGTEEDFQKTAAAFSSGSDVGYDFSKKDEFLYFVNGRAIKFFRDRNISKERVERARNMPGFVPTIDLVAGRFYSYRMIEGDVLYKMIDGELFGQLLQWLHGEFWQKAVVDASAMQKFKDKCRFFYFDKTEQRIRLYFDLLHQSDNHHEINGCMVPSVEGLFKKVVWENLCNGVPVRFHGDLQFDNILITKSDPKRFVLIDWRQNFGGLTEYGDLYYDLAKLYGGILLPYDLIKKGKFFCRQNGDQIRFGYETRPSLLNIREKFQRMAVQFGYDFERIRTLTAIIFLNMAPLHTPPFNIMLHHLGKSMLFAVQNRQDDSIWLKQTIQ